MPALRMPIDLTVLERQRVSAGAIKLMLSLTFVKGLLDYGYASFVSVIFGYQGFDYSFNILRYTESWIIVGFLVLIMPKRVQRISDIFMIILVSGLVVPMASLYGLSSQSWYAMYMIVVSVLVINISRKLKINVRIPYIIGGNKIFLYLSVIFIVGNISALFFVGENLNFNLDISSVYEFRDENADAINQGMMYYINSWTSKVIGPALVAYSFYTRGRFIMIFTIMTHILIFGFVQHKAVVFYPIFTIIICYWIYKNPSSHLYFIFIGFLLLSSVLIYLIMENNFIPSLLIRRLFFAGAINTFEYFKFFSENSYIYWSNSSVTFGMIEYPYSLPPGEVVGAARGTDSNANNSFLSTGYMHAGLVGLAIYCIIAGLLFRFIDSLVSPEVPVWVIAGPFIVSVRALLLSTDLLVAFLSHGILLALGIAMLIRKPQVRPIVSATAASQWKRA